MIKSTRARRRKSFAACSGKSADALPEVVEQHVFLRLALLDIRAEGAAAAMRQNQVLVHAMKFIESMR